MSPPTRRRPGRPASAPPSAASAPPGVRIERPMRRLLALLITLTLVPAATALAGGGAAVIRDCTDDGVLQGHYTQRQLREALSSLPSDVDEYTNCRDVIRGAAFGGAGGGGKGGGGSEFGGFQG